PKRQWTETCVWAKMHLELSRNRTLSGSPTSMELQMSNASNGILLSAIFAIISLLSVMAGCSSQASRADKPHHTTNGFRNVNSPKHPGFTGFLKWRWDRLWQGVPSPESFSFPVAANDPAFLRSNGDKITFTWIGHATALLQLSGKNILTDPHFSERASPVSWAGPKRVVQPGLSLDQLPHIDMVVISHDHYDSLDTSSITALHARDRGDQTTYFVPLGLKSWFRDLGIERVIELDWWEKHKLDGLELIAVPVQHWSKRGPVGRNETLWAGWVVRSNDFSFFFAGDSGYTPHFAEIGRKLGPFDLSAIPIGAYEPRWFMRYSHMSPEESVQVHKDVRSKRSVGIHWGTFMLTDEPLDEPPKRLRVAGEKNKLAKDEFVALKHGETIIIKPDGDDRSN
ncbi:MBL fold metallo-hydrolase, partial [Thermodesulfobacteriota bacterium]